MRFGMDTRAKRKIWCAAWLAWLALACPCAWAASAHVETFSSGTAGWSQAGSLQLAATNQSLRGLFVAQGVPMPEIGSFVATNVSSGGAFTGDYDAAGIRLIGFSFMAQNVLPSAALLRWQGPTSSFFRSFASVVTTTGVWYRFAFSLASKDAGKWVGGSDIAFAESMLAVQGLEIQLTRAGMAAQRYYVDDVFVDALPWGSVGTASPTGGLPVVWSSLRPNVAYVVQTAEQPSNSWNYAGNFVATNTTQAWPDFTATNHQRVYRLLFNEIQ